MGRALEAEPSGEDAEAVISAPVEEAPLELETALPGPDAENGQKRVQAAEVLTADPEAIVESQDIEIPAPKADPVEPVVLNAEAVTLGTGETFKLKVVSGVCKGKTDYWSTDAKVVAVSSTGTITGRKRGGAMVIVTMADGRSALCKVTVKAAPKSIALNVRSLRLGYDEKRVAAEHFRLKARLSGDAASKIRYSGYDPAVVTVSDAGKIVARGKGTTTVTATTFNGLKASVEVHVLSAPEAVVLDRTALKLFPGEKYKLKVRRLDNTAGNVRFASSDPGVATVDARTGKVIAVSRGSAIITATSFNGRVAVCAVEVGYAPVRIALAKKKITLGVGETFALKARPLRRNGKSANGVVRYTSSGAAATVRSGGTVKGVKPGKAIITATTANGVKAICKVTVKAAPTSVTLMAASPKLTVGEKTKLKAKLSQGSASALTWSGYDSGVIEVSAQGQIRAIGPGETRVIAMTYNGRWASCTVRVYAKNSRQTQIIAHRGGAGNWAENSLEAFSHAAATGADLVELDVRTTRDDALVVHHDSTFVARGRKYCIENLSLAEIQALDPEICSLDEALQIISASGLGLVLEMKNSADPEACVRAVSRYGMEKRVYYIAFDESKLRTVRSLRPRAQIGMLFTRTPANLEESLAALKPVFVSQQASSLTRDNLIRWQNQGLLVGVWTVNDATQMSELLDMGVDYLTSDDPRLAAALADR